MFLLWLHFRRPILYKTYTSNSQDDTIDKKCNWNHNVIKDYKPNWTVNTTCNVCDKRAITKNKSNHKTN